MTLRYIKIIALAALMSIVGWSCTEDLNLQPKNEITSATVYEDFSNYKNVLAKLYGGYSLTGQGSGTGRQDVQGVDEGASAYFRTYWNMQELPTDEAKLAWTADPGVNPLNLMTWSSNNVLTQAMYYRIFYQITLANEFIRETSESALASRNIEGQNATDAGYFHAEARFLRALSYWHAMDLYGNVPFITEEDGVGTYFPEQISRADLFTYIESELLAIVDHMVPARQNEYGRADQAAVWTLLTKLYLNAEVYTAEPRYTEAITYASNVIASGYVLDNQYAHLFLADNQNASGIIFPIVADGVNARSYGVSTYLAHAAVGGSMNAASFGINGGWYGLRTTSSLVNRFTALDADQRAMFYTDGQQLEIEDLATFTDGYAVTKFKNVTSVGEAGSDPSLNYVDTDYPLFRLADIYLMYAEAVLRGGSGGSPATALEYINLLRQRAYGNTEGNIALNELTLDFVLDERSRELYWEGHRRTDLIRYGRFTGGNYLWPWKGGAQEGTTVPAFRNLYPIPASDLTANPNLVQNDNY